jgi:hypothetical protein
MASPAWPQLGVEILGSTEVAHLLEEAGITRKENQTFAISRQFLQSSIPLRPSECAGSVGSRLTTQPLYPLRALLYRHIQPGSAGSILPMDSCDGATECSPTSLIDRQGHRFVVIGYQVGTQYRSNAHGCAGMLELDGAIDSVRVGASQRPEAPAGRCLGKRLGARDAESEGKVGVNVQVGEHLYPQA